MKSDLMFIGPLTGALNNLSFGIERTLPEWAIRTTTETKVAIDILQRRPVDIVVAQLDANLLDDALYPS